MPRRWTLAVLVVMVATGCGASGAPAVWWVAPDQDVDPDTQTLDVLVLENECASGQPATGRVQDPVIESDDERVVVTFRIRPVGEATCPSNPPTPHTLDLGEPLGDRVLLDGGNVARCRDKPDELPPEHCKLRQPVPGDL